MRDEVSAHAWALFAQQGYEATTVEQIAEAAGMSPRTFFRYVTSKDELLLERLLEHGPAVADRLADAAPDVPAWRALRDALDAVVVPQDADAAQVRPLVTMLRDEPAVRAATAERRHRWEQLLAPVLAARLSAPGAAVTADDARVLALAGAALACLDAAQLAWVGRPAQRLADLLDAAMGAVSPL